MPLGTWHRKTGTEKQRHNCRQLPRVGARRIYNAAGFTKVAVRAIPRLSRLSSHPPPKKAKLLPTHAWLLRFDSNSGVSAITPVKSFYTGQCPE